MPSVALRHAWLQKHASPTSRGGDFHWHPATLPSSVTGALSEALSRAHQDTTTLCLLEPEHIMWARTFSTISPEDRRRYTGLAATIASSDATLASVAPDVLEHLRIAPAQPHSGDSDAVQTANIDAGLQVWPLDQEKLRELFPRREALSRALLDGGHVPCRSPHDEALPRVMGQLLSWLPERERLRRRCLFLSAREGEEPKRISASHSNLVHYLASAWFGADTVGSADPVFANRSWQLVLDLCRVTGQPLAELFAALTELATCWDTAEHLAEHLLRNEILSPGQIRDCDARAPAPLVGQATDAGRLWTRILHYWGRGLLAPEDEQFESRLARVLAMRITADHLFALDDPSTGHPLRYLRRLRYEALLTHQRVASLSQRVRSFVPSLLAVHGHPSP